MLARDQPKRILARSQRLSLDEHVVGETNPSGRVCTGMPNAVPRNQRAKERSPARDRTSISHGDVGVRNHLRDAAPLTEGVALRASATREGDGCEYHTP